MANSWVFIDSRVSDKDLLMSQFEPGTRYTVLDENHDGVGQIVTALSGLNGYDSIQIISHGSSGSITIGSTELNSSTLDFYSSELAFIGNALTESGDLLLYGCSVGAGDVGQQFIERLSQLTGADVAASDDLTGGTASGGDWTLEVQIGAIDHPELEYPVNLDVYNGVLATLTNAGFESDMTGWSGSSASISTGGGFSNGWTVTPYGSKMAFLLPGSVDRATTFSALMVGTAGQNYLNGQFSNPTNFAYLYQDVSLSAGAVISMAWNYIATDYAPYNDASWVSFVNMSNTSDASMQINVGAYGYTVSQVAILGATVSGTGNYVTGNYGSTGWQYLSLKAGGSGTYRIGFAAFNLADTVLSPYLIIDQDRGLTYNNGVIFEPIGPPTNPPEPPGLVGPTLTAFSGSLGTIAEDTEIAISLNDLLLKGNEADSDGTVTGFIVDGVSTGTLKIGADAASAIPFNASTNNKIDATHNAYWTSSQNANGVLNAFTVYAVDNDSLTSATAVQTTVSVTAVNDAPVIGCTSITAFTEQTPVRLGDDIVISDPDGDAGWNGGTLKVQITANAEMADMLSLPSTNPGAGAIWLDSAGNRLMAGSTQIGTSDAVSVSSGTQWSFTFNANATTALVQSLARSLVFGNSSDHPGTSARTITLTVIDNAGASGHFDRTLSISQVNDAPVFSGFSGVVGTANEDTEAVITLDLLKAQGDETDVDGTVDAFVVLSLTSGHLKIGTDALSATVWDAVTNNTIDAIHHAYWTGSENANGMIDAFAVVAKDNEGSFSGAAFQAVVNVTPVNDQPVLTIFTDSVASTDEDVEVAITYDALQAQGDAADIDGTVTAFVIKSLTSGSLKIGTDEALATAWDAVANNTIDATHHAYWRGAENANGTIAAFMVVARDDNGDESIGAVQVSVDVSPVNDAPSLFVGADSHGSEGEWFNHVITLGDPDPDAHLITVQWGDGTGNTEFDSGMLHSLDISHYYADNGTYTVTVTADDHQGQGNSVETRSFQVAVSNVAPSASVTGDDRVNDGANYILHVGAVVDPGLDTRTAYSIDWGDGSSSMFTPAQWAAAAGEFNHTYDTPGSAEVGYTAVVHVTDEDGSFVLGSKSITVNVPPTNLALSNDRVPENSPAGTLAGSLSSTDDGAHTYTLLESAGGLFSLSGNQILVAEGAVLDYESDPLHTIRVRSTDSEGLSFEKELSIQLSDMGPDLIVSGAGSSQTITDIDYGSSMEIFWTVATQGTEASNATWIDRVYFDNPATPGLDYWIGDYPVSMALPLADALTRIQTAQLPSNMYGDFRIVVLADFANQVNEGASAEGNNISYGDTIYTILNSNLQVSSVTASSSAITGREIGIEWIVGNTGNAGTDNRYWYDAVYLSADTVLDGSDVSLGVVRNESYLENGEQYHNTASVTLPSGIQGEYHILVATDLYNHVPEGGHENDNVTSSAIIDIQPVPVSELSDPAVASVAAPAQALSGQNMSITYTIDNAGQAAISGSSPYWVERIYMSSDDVLDGSDRLLNSIWRDLSASQIPQPEGATHFTTTEKVMLPVGVSGNFWFFVTVSPVGSVTNVFTSNDVAFDATPVDVRLTPPPDLEVSGINISGTALAGHDLTVSYRVLNTGATTTPNAGWYDNLYLSSDTTLDGGDTLLNSVWHSGQLSPAGRAETMTLADAITMYTRGAATGYYINTVNVHLNDALNGTYHLLASTDVTDIVFELDNGNNTGNALAVDIQSHPADLVVSDLRAPAVSQAGQSLRVTWSVLNQGSGDTGVSQWYDRLVLSNDSIPGNGDDVVLGTYVHSGALGINQSYSNSALVSIPANLSGNYQLFVTADIFSQVYENGYEGNNFRPLGVGLEWHPGDVIPDPGTGGGGGSGPYVGIETKPQPTADLRVVSVTVPDRVNSGENMSVTYTVTNAGEGSTNSNHWWDKVTLSTDSVLGNSDDVVLGTVWHSNTLVSGESYTASASMAIPIDLSGNYLVFVTTDAYGYVTESGAENNNDGQASNTTTIDLSPVPDLVMSTLNAADEGMSGQNLSVSWTLRNNGADTTGGWRQTFYLSRDGVLDRNTDIYLGYTDRGIRLGSGDEVNLSASFRIPVGISGKYYVFGVADSGNWIYERSGESNNTALDSTSVQITAPDPVDLVAGVITVPVNGVAGGSASIGYTVTNESGLVLNGQWRDNIYLSTDTDWDVGDALFDRVEVSGPISAGGSYSQVATGTLPGLVGGDYYVIVRSDILNQVTESDETNNLNASVDSTHLDVEVLNLGTPDSAIITARGAVYYRVDAEAGDTLKISFDRDAAAGRTELYVSYGDMPSRSDFDYRYSVADSPDQSIVIPNAKGGSYYVMAYNTVGSNDSYTVSADKLVFSITELGTDTGSNLGKVTVRIEGAELTIHTVAMLVDSGGIEHTAEQIYWKDNSELWATFDLHGLATGIYDVRIQDGVHTAELTDGFTVNSGKAGHVDYSLETPSALRPGQTGTVRVYYQNTGETDVAAPLLNVSGNALFKVSGDAEFGGTSVQLLGINSNGPAGILSPGSEGSFQLFFKPDFSGGGTVDLSVSSVNPDEVIDWNTILDSGRPDNISSESWETIKANLIAELGTTAGDYQDNLSGIATLLDQVEGRTSSIETLFSLDYQKAIAGGSLSRPETIGVLGYSQTFAWDITATTQTDGSVQVNIAGSKLLFTHQDDGSYKLSGQGTATLAEAGGAFTLHQQNGMTISFNLEGSFEEIRDANGHTTQAVYADGKLIEVVTSTGNHWAYTYNEAGRIITEVDQAGRVVGYTYDADNQHLLNVTTVDGATQYSYVTEGAAKHLVSTVTFADGTVKHYEYDSAGRLVSEYLNDHAEMQTYSYVGVNEVIVADANGASTHLWLDESGQIAQREDALGNVTQLRYDDNGNLTGVVNADGTSSGISYDASGNTVSTQDALGHTVSFSYATSFGHISEVTDQRGNAIGYGYDDNGNLSSITYADGSSDSYSYDSNGYLSVSVSRSGETIGYTYDAQGQLILKNFADGTTASYTYDDHGNMMSAIDADSHTTFEYDAADHLVKVTDTDGRWISYAYDDAGRRIETGDQVGNITHYSYDALGHLDAVTDGVGAMIAAYKYDAAGNLIRGDNGNGTYTTYDYDAAGQLVHLVNFQEDGSVNSRFDYTYDEMGRRTSETTLEGTSDYLYDAIGQLTEVTMSSGRHIVYHYDAAGNRTLVEDSGSSTTYAANDLNEYTSAGAVTYGYDENGNMISKVEGGVETTYGYDAENHLVSVITSTDTWSYEYDALGNRIASEHNGERTEFQLDLSGMVNVAAEYDAIGDRTASYVYGIGLESEMLSEGTIAWYDFNAIGSTAGLTDSTGSYLNAYSYLPFGETLSITESITNPFEYVGQWGVMDEGNGLDFMRARYYSADEGRFTSTDPIGISGGLNLYGYTLNDPLTGIDPNGEVVWFVAPLIGAGVGGGIDLTIQLVTNGGDINQVDWGSVGISAGVGAGLGMLGPSGIIFGRGGQTAAKMGYQAGILNTGSEFRVGWSFFKGTGSQWFSIHGKTVEALFGKAHIDLFSLPKWITHGVYEFGIGGGIVGAASVRVVQPRDPNDIVGPQGYGDEHWAGTQNALPYTIHFENQASATAPAQEVTVTQTFDSDLDPASFRLGDFGWGDLYVDVPDDALFYIDRIDLTATKGYMVDVVAGIDIEKHEAYWSFTTIDPSTGEIPADPTIGFLPPDSDGVIGQGFVNYTINPNAGVTTGTVIDAEATIVFTTQEPIDTPAISNTLDVDLPVSQLDPLAGMSEVTVDSAQFLVQWSGSDTGSAIASYSVYVSDNGGEFTAWLEESELTEANYEGEQGHTYAFYTRAADNAGNVEAAPSEADLVVHVNADAVLSDTASPQIAEVQLPSSRQYVAGESLDFTIRFSEAVIVDVSGDAPAIKVTIGSSDADAVYQSGSGSDSILFSYVIAEGESDTNGIVLGGEIVSNGAVIRDIAGNLIADLTFSSGATDGIRIDLAPTLTSFSDPVGQTTRNKLAAISLAELLAKGNEADADGTVDAVVIGSLTSGSLLIGTDAASATVYDALTNNTVDATHQAFWTPAPDTYGVLDAFTVVAKDNAGIPSATPVQVKVEVLEAIVGSTGNDQQSGAAGDDHMYGEEGNDSLVGNEGNDLLDGGTGADRMEGGPGNDMYVVDNPADVVKETAGNGTDTIQSSVTWTLGLNVENLTLTGSDAINGKGNTLSNVVNGNEGANVLNGATGNDTILGGGGNDTINGGTGVDVMTGGAGHDLFVFDYLATTESGVVSTSHDIITDFVSGQDRLDLSAIDAQVALSGNQVFDSTIQSGMNPFTAAGQLRFDGATGLLYGNTDSNLLTAEFTIELTGVTSLVAGDIIC